MFYTGFLTTTAQEGRQIEAQHASAGILLNSQRSPEGRHTVIAIDSPNVSPYVASLYHGHFPWVVPWTTIFRAYGAIGGEISRLE